MSEPFWVLVNVAAIWSSSKGNGWSENDVDVECGGFGDAEGVTKALGVRKVGANVGRRWWRCGTRR